MGGHKINGCNASGQVQCTLQAQHNLMDTSKQTLNMKKRGKLKQKS